MNFQIAQLMSEPPVQHNIYDEFTFTEGKHSFRTFDYDIVSLFYRNNSDSRLTVFLNDAVSYSRDVANFDRLAEYSSCEGLQMYFEDSLGRKMKFIPCCYYGMLDELEIIVRRVMLDRNIRAADVTFVSAQFGGFAASYLAEQIKGAGVVAFNPVLSVMDCFPNRARAAEFLTKFNIPADRDRKSNPKLFLSFPVSVPSTFIYHINLNDEMAMKQFKIMQKHLGIPDGNIHEGCLTFKNMSFNFHDLSAEDFEEQTVNLLSGS